MPLPASSNKHFQWLSHKDISRNSIHKNWIPDAVGHSCVKLTPSTLICMPLEYRSICYAVFQEGWWQVMWLYALVLASCAWCLLQEHPRSAGDSCFKVRLPTITAL